MPRLREISHYQHGTAGMNIAPLYCPTCRLTTPRFTLLLSLLSSRYAGEGAFYAHYRTTMQNQETVCFTTDDVWRSETGIGFDPASRWAGIGLSGVILRQVALVISRILPPAVNSSPIYSTHRNVVALDGLRHCRCGRSRHYHHCRQP